MHTRQATRSGVEHLGACRWTSLTGAEGVRAIALVGVGAADTTHFSVLRPVGGVIMVGVLQRETKSIGTGQASERVGGDDRPVPIHLLRRRVRLRLLHLGSGAEVVEQLVGEPSCSSGKHAGEHLSCNARQTRRLFS